MTCPCCTSTKPQPGARELYRLCDDCLKRAIRYAQCPHERKAGE